ncbi:MAG TPA: DUF4388 domain-containing protein [Pyrinomonadaceae bacterium]|nr:DUF4388 domain-containing protein [Pyrinomonadaceae bacterium]
MENVERTQFVVLTGHLDESPLPELIRRLRVQRKSGRLRVEYSEGPGSFFFEDGQMVDAQLGDLRGVEALYAALALPNASFNFNPLVRPPERNIGRQEQQFIRDLTEAPRREGLSEIRVAGGAAVQPAPVPFQPNATLGQQHAALQQQDAQPQQNPAFLLPAAAEEFLAPLDVRLSAVEGAIATAARRFSRERLVYAVVIGFLVGLSFVTTLGIVYGPLGRTHANADAAPAQAASSQAASAQPAQAASVQNVAAPHDAAAQNGDANAATGAKAGDANAGSSPAGSTPSDDASAKVGDDASAEAPPVPAAAAVIGSRRFDSAPAPRREYVVEVLVEVKAGQVTDARVWNPRLGAAAYEAVALRMARERRYPEGFSGGERLKIRVKP